MAARHVLFALLLCVGCSSESTEPHNQAPTQVPPMQAPQVPQQTAAASPPAMSQVAPMQPMQQAHTESAKLDAAMPAHEQTPPQAQAQAMQDASMRAPDAAQAMQMMPAQMMPAQIMPTQMMPAADAPCQQRKVEGPTGVFFHHVHFNTTDPDADLAFYEKYFNTKSIDFCTKPGGAPATKATVTERGYFLFTRVATPPDPTLNAYLEHIGWCNPDPVSELQRQAMLGAPLWKSDPGRGQCETAAAGTRPCNDYWFYLQSPSGAKVEIALGPGPATMGFGHVHVIMGEDLTWYEKVTGGRYKDTAIDMVNITDALEDESYLKDQKVTDTRGKPIDHIAFSTSNLMAERDRIKAAGIEIAEDISFKPEFGFQSFFVKSAKGIWVEMVEDSAFAP